MKTLRTFALAAAAMMASTGWATAQEAISTADVNMRAGPGSRYPVVTTVPEGREVFIHGCLADFDWCDVSWRRNRGWVFSDFLEGSYGQSYVPFYEYRRRTTLPVISFGFGYWDRNYRDRPWFDDWDRWDQGRDGNRNRNRNRDRNNDNQARDRDNDDDNQARNRNDDDENQARNRNRDRDQSNDDGDDDRNRNVVRGENRNRERVRNRNNNDAEGQTRRERLNCDDDNADPRCGNINENRTNRRSGTMEDAEENMMP